MLLEEFNSADRAAAVIAVRPALDIARWIDAIVDGRPYASVAALAEAAITAAAPFSEGELDAALAHHPRIGARVEGSTAEAAHSRREQPSIDDETAAALVEGNRAYEERFDRVFLVRAAGRTATEILALLHERLGSTDEQELAVVEQQLREIAALRLEASLQTEGARP
ncbi:2-oxo-4-hydroxy-4-carboxy-5-ureidoimidazoline decarboxylase [uncultured Microbacterium sp.]|uniref:2-oxo-4-hydroxy-4-carboxy-5-ureidoimidazoline decarboxylase n=1 Tax=uncultured Microbacterium sp. TaxID=191216 RepID=UPI0025F068BE|nr:2-oxo-4-hydroxy-4-carboxy-5-ureidoimidazoline decarboxylase [uncultured Microbacterium sp.]